MRRRVWRAMSVLLSAPAFWAVLLATPALALVYVTATVETDPVHTEIDAADDTAIWIHPTHPERSTVIGTDNKGWGLAVYDLAGKEIFYDASVRPNNVDLRYNFPLDGDRVPLVAFSKVPDGSIGVYTVDPTTRHVVDIAARTFDGLASSSTVPAGFCLYRSATTGKHYGFVVNLHAVEQWELFDDGHGRVDAARVRTLPLDTNEAEGCVADDETGALYVSDEDRGIWKYAAESDAGDSRTLMESVQSGRLRSDVEGLALYKTQGGSGYLIAASQHANRWDVFDRQSNTYVGPFSIVASETIDEVTGSDGIEVTNFPLGPSFPEGLVVVQDNENAGGQNFKYVPWESVAGAFDPDLAIDTTYDPRTAGGGSGGNRPPFVTAGPDTVVTADQAHAVDLEGSVADDGLPALGALAMTWSAVSAPADGTISFADTSAASTSATFSRPGRYRVRLRATDGELSFSDTAVVTVGDVVTAESRVAASDDDAEEDATGVVNTTGGDLEFVRDAATQTVGLRFADLDVPPGATVLNAYVQLKADEVHSNAASLTIAAEAADSAGAFAATLNNVTARPLAEPRVQWSPPPWPVVGDAGAAQRTADLSPLLQSVVDRPGWAAGNAAVLVVSGSGKRVAEAFDGDAAGAALLHVEYLPAVNAPPVVSAGTDQTLTTETGQLDGSVSDDGLPNGTLATTWTVLQAPPRARVEFADPSSAQTSATFSKPGTYLLRLSADDGAATASDTVAVTLTPPTIRNRRVTTGRDDARERQDGRVRLQAVNLGLGDGRGAGTIGIRFRKIPIPRNATVTRAWVRFTAGATNRAGARLVIRAHATHHAPVFTNTAQSISQRPRTRAAVVWEPAPWTVGDARIAQRTPDLARVVQVIVNRGRWQPGNALALIVRGDGRRVAQAFEGGAAGAAVLHLEYRSD